MRRISILTLTIALALLSACGDDPPAPTSPVDPPADPPADVDVAFCRGLEPAWVAFQDGDGQWTRVEPAVAGSVTTFHGTFAAGRGAVATARRFASGLTALAVFYGTPGELTLVGDTSPRDCSPATGTLHGTVTGLDTNEVAFVSAGLSTHRDAAFPGERNDFTLGDLAAGPQDLLATRVTVVGGAGTLTGLILRRGIEVADSGTVAPLDFASAEAFAPAVRDVTIQGLGPEGALTQSGFHTARSEHVLEFVPVRETAATRAYRAIPEAKLQPGDLLVLLATTAPTIGNVRRAATLWYRAPVDRTLALGALPTPPTIAVEATTPSLRPRARLATQADYDRLTSINYQQGQNTVVTVSMTPAFAARTAGGYDLVVPELSGVTGFDPAWALRPGGGTLIWTVARIGGSLGFALGTEPREGDTRRVASDAGFFTP